MEFTVVHFILDLLLHIAFIGVAIPVVFFTYGTQLQKQVVKEEVLKIVHDFLRPLMGVVAYMFKGFKWESITTAESEKIQRERNEAIRTKVKYGLIIIFTVAFGLFGAVLAITQMSFPWDLALTNIIMTVAVIAAEVTFLAIVVRRYRPIDVDDIQQRLIEKLESAV